ncbi:hypothetical protein SAY86_015010 [Trapa natans]|uniref:BHLH domain-containing protein n=1 Tax=Trapa natans TaxID=22666 RepID=A0AAN7KPH6_TRANT|nr:hypothetical protein SAY86_015010 [Trapa natans]
MSSRRSRQSSSLGSSRINDDQIVDLLSKLRRILPKIHDSGCSNKVSKVLQETCNYIRSLHREVDNLSEWLFQQLGTIDADSPEVAIIRSLILQ